MCIESVRTKLLVKLACFGKISRITFLCIGGCAAVGRDGHQPRDADIIKCCSGIVKGENGIDIRRNTALCLLLSDVDFDQTVDDAVMLFCLSVDFLCKGKGVQGVNQIDLVGDIFDLIGLQTSD